MEVEAPTLAARKAKARALRSKPSGATSAEMPQGECPQLTLGDMLKLKSSTKRYKIDLIIVGAKHCTPTGEPIPHENPRFPQQSQLVLLAEDSTGALMTVEVTSDDITWLHNTATQLLLNKTVTFEQPVFSPSK